MLNNTPTVLSSSALIAFAFSLGLTAHAAEAIKVGVVTPEFLVKNRKYAVLAAFVVAAILTPPDVFSQVLLAVPLFLLFEVSIFVAKRVARGRETSDGPDQQ